jgi:hypothetical protein
MNGLTELCAIGQVLLFFIACLLACLLACQQEPEEANEKK